MITMTIDQRYNEIYNNYHLRRACNQIFQSSIKGITLSREELEDLWQDTLLKVAISNRVQDHYFNYVRAVAYTTAIDFTRATSFQFVYDFHYNDIAPMKDDHISVLIWEAEQEKELNMEILMFLIPYLKGYARQAIEWRLDGLTFREISIWTGHSESGLKKRHSLSTKQLKSWAKKEY